MTPAELNALNRLVSEKVMGWTQAGPAFKSGEFHICHDGSVLISTDGGKMQFFNPAESPADAMAVLKKCNEHINERKYREVIGLSTICGDPCLSYRPDAIIESAPTLETAICQFAVKLLQ